MSETTTQPEQSSFDATAAAAWISATARNSGMTIAAEALQVAAGELAGAVERDATGSFAYLPEAGASAFRVEGGEVREIAVETFVAGILLKHATPVAPKPSRQIAPQAIPEPKSSAPNWTRGRQDTFAVMVRAQAAHEDEKIAKECETWPNPFLKENWNRTHQSIMMNKNPALAVKYKAEAGL